jgi:hypothetical protein
MSQRRQRPEDAGVADEHVELAPALVDGGAQGIDLVVGLEVEREQRGAAATGPYLVVDLLERAGGAADQDQMCAFLGVGQRHGSPHAAGGPRDQG